MEESFSVSEQMKSITEVGREGGPQMAEWSGLAKFSIMSQTPLRESLSYISFVLCFCVVRGKKTFYKLLALWKQKSHSLDIWHSKRQFVVKSHRFFRDWAPLVSSFSFLLWSCLILQLQLRLKHIHASLMIAILGEENFIFHYGILWLTQQSTRVDGWIPRQRIGG